MNYGRPAAMQHRQQAESILGRLKVTVAQVSLYITYYTVYIHKILYMILVCHCSCYSNCDHITYSLRILSY